MNGYNNLFIRNVLPFTIKHEAQKLMDIIIYLSETFYHLQLSMKPEN